MDSPEPHARFSVGVDVAVRATLTTKDAVVKAWREAEKKRHDAKDAKDAKEAGPETPGDEGGVAERRRTSPNEPVVVPNRLDALVPDAEVRASIAEFQRSVLDPALAPAVADAEWDVFVGNLRKLRINDDDFDGKDGENAVMECLAAHAEYVAMREERRAAREERERDAAGAVA